MARSINAGVMRVKEPRARGNTLWRANLNIDEAGKQRIPDFVEEIGPNRKPSKMVEAKNVKSQGYSDQIRAYEKMAKNSGDPDAKVEIRMRSENHPEGPTKPSRALLKASKKRGSIIKLLYTIDF